MIFCTPDSSRALIVLKIIIFIYAFTYIYIHTYKNLVEEQMFLVSQAHAEYQK